MHTCLGPLGADECVFAASRAPGCLRPRRTDVCFRGELIHFVRVKWAEMITPFDVRCTDLVEIYRWRGAHVFRSPRRRSVCFRGKSRLRVPAPEAHGRVFSLQVDSFCACKMGRDDDTFEFGDVRCTDLIEIYLWVQPKARVCGQ